MAATPIRIDAIITMPCRLKAVANPVSPNNEVELLEVILLFQQSHLLEVVMMTLLLVELLLQADLVVEVVEEIQQLKQVEQEIHHQLVLLKEILEEAEHLCQHKDHQHHTNQEMVVAVEELEQLEVQAV